uniref:Ras and EF-hand domain-containing protein n=1 Tax=Cacopsylla melanoneura TaxID=428564 RepID=A0A8D8SIK4_9HEMI
MSDLQLEELFKTCDKKGTGQIGPEEFRELCTGFDIQPADSDAIFADLDHDGDGKVSLEDFAYGFREYLNSNMRKQKNSSAASSEAMERRNSEVQNAWSLLLAGIGEANVNKFLNTSGKKLADLYHELRTSSNCPEIVTHFEGALSSLLDDVKRLHEDNEKLEEMFNREREVHLERLKGLEEELDVQVAKVVTQAKEEARAKYEQEKSVLMRKMEHETQELQAHLNLFQKVNNVLNQKKTEKQIDPSMNKNFSFENKELKMTLEKTKTNLDLVHAEMAQLKNEYEGKCQELNHQQTTLMQYIGKTDHVQKQLQLLHETNKKLQDTNDSLLSIVDVASKSRPPTPCCYSADSSNSEMDGRSNHTKCHHRVSSRGPSRGTSEVGDLMELDQGSDKQFAIQRLMEDIDSGRSTMRDNVDCGSDYKSNEENMSSLSEYDFNKRDYAELRRQHSSKANSAHMSLTNSLEPTGEPDRAFKIVFAGDAAVGKSCFIYRFSKEMFLNKLGSTLGVDFQMKTIRVDERNVALQLWDTAGQERFRSMTKNYFRRADGVMLLYDVTNERSFNSVKNWVEAVEEVTEHAIPIAICANKVDLRADAQAKGIKCVEREVGQKLAEQYGAIFMETSSKSGDNIMDALISLSREMLTREDVEVQTSALRVTNMVTKKSCCNKSL